MAEAAAGAASRRLTLLSVSYVGGVAGGLARYSITTGQPTAPGQLPWVTFGVNTLPHAAPTLARLSISTAFDELAGAMLVIEAVPEDLRLKESVLRRVEDVMRVEAVIATNTSSLSLDVLVGFLAHPERLIGLHFFNPVPASRLVEVVLAARPLRRCRRKRPERVRALQTPVVVRNSPGFASSRLGVAVGLEAIRMPEQGVAAAEDIDAAMTLGYGHPVRPAAALRSRRAGRPPRNRPVSARRTRRALRAARPARGEGCQR